MLRFFAAFIVVLFHLNQPIPHLDNWYRNLVSYGWVGVPVFFVISGFCIMLAAGHAKESGNFLRRRFFRIFPPYWVSLLVVLVAALFQKAYIGYNSIGNLPVTVLHVLANLSLLTFPFNKVPTINWVYWSLTCEVFFYLVIGLLLLFKRKLTVPLLLLFSLLAALWPCQHTGYLFFLDHWPAFGCGLGLFFILENPGANSRLASWALLGINLCGLLYKFLPAAQFAYPATTIVILGIIYLGRYAGLRKSLPAVLGTHSYAVYLIHVPVGVFILGLFNNAYIQQHVFLNLAFDLACYGIISILAWQFFNLIEKPSILYGKTDGKKFYLSKRKERN